MFMEPKFLDLHSTAPAHPHPSFSLSCLKHPDSQSLSLKCPKHVKHCQGAEGAIPKPVLFGIRHNATQVYPILHFPADDNRSQTLCAASPMQGLEEQSDSVYSKNKAPSGIQDSAASNTSSPIILKPGQELFRIITDWVALNLHHHSEKLGKSLLKALWCMRVPKIFNSKDMCF